MDANDEINSVTAEDEINKEEIKSRLLSYEERLEIIKGLSLFNDKFFSAVMRHKEAAQEVLRIITGNDDLKIIECRTQESFRNIYGKSSVLDFTAEDNNNNIRIIEIQTYENKKYFNPKRIRFYQSSVDSSLFDKGETYDKLPDTYSYFLTTFNMFEDLGLDEFIYEKKSTISGLAEWDDGSHIIIINASAAKGNSALEELMLYFLKADPTDKRFGALSEKVAYYKLDEEGIMYMDSVIDKYIDARLEIYGNQLMAKVKAEGIAKGKAEGIAEGKAEGIAEGKAEGIAEGKAEGIAEGKIEGAESRSFEIAHNLIKNGYDRKDAFNIAMIDEKTYLKYYGNVD